MKKINFIKLKEILYQEGYHILLLSDSRINSMTTLTPHISRSRGLVHGLVMPDRNEIAINENLSLKERVLTLVHELIHIADKRYSEKVTEKLTHKLYKNFSDGELGFMEFAVSHDG